MKNLQLPLRALNHVSLVVQDVEASISFYRDVLGFYEIRRPESFHFDGAWLWRYGVSVHLIQGKSTFLLSRKRILPSQEELCIIHIDYLFRTMQECRCHVAPL